MSIARKNKVSGLLEDRLSVHQLRIDDILEKEINFVPLVKFNVSHVDLENEPSNDYFDVLTKQHVRNLLAIKLTMTQDAINHRNSLDHEIEELIELIDEKMVE